MQLIPNDPLGRYTFSYKEQNWDVQHNINWVKSVGQMNGHSSSIQTLQTNINSHGTTLTGLTSDVTNLKTVLGIDGGPSLYITRTAFHKAIEAQALSKLIQTAAIGATQLVTTPLQGPVKVGAVMFIYDLTNDNVSTFTLAAEAVAGQTSLTVLPLTEALPAGQPIFVSQGYLQGSLNDLKSFQNSTIDRLADIDGTLVAYRSEVNQNAQEFSVVQSQIAAMNSAIGSVSSRLALTASSLDITLQQKIEGPSGLVSRLNALSFTINALENTIETTVNSLHTTEDTVTALGTWRIQTDSAIQNAVSLATSANNRSNEAYSLITQTATQFASEYATLEDLNQTTQALSTSITQSANNVTIQARQAANLDASSNVEFAKVSTAAALGATSLAVTLDNSIKGPGNEFASKVYLRAGDQLTYTVIPAGGGAAQRKLITLSQNVLVSQVFTNGAPNPSVTLPISPLGQALAAGVSLVLLPFTSQGQINVTSDTIDLLINGGNNTPGSLINTLNGRLQDAAGGVSIKKGVMHSINYNGNISTINPATQLVDPDFGAGYGTQGWAAYEDGTLVATNLHARGTLTAQQGALFASLTGYNVVDELTGGSFMTDAAGLSFEDINGVDVGYIGVSRMTTQSNQVTDAVHIYGRDYLSIRLGESFENVALFTRARPEFNNSPAALFFDGNISTSGDLMIRTDEDGIGEMVLTQADAFYDIQTDGAGPNKKAKVRIDGVEYWITLQPV